MSELEKQFSQGKHKAPENYDDKILADAGYDKDDEIVGAYTKWAKDNKISQKAFDDLAGSIIGMAGEREQEEKSIQNERLKNLDPMPKKSSPKILSGKKASKGKKSLRKKKTTY